VVSMEVIQEVFISSIIFYYYTVCFFYGLLYYIGESALCIKIKNGKMSVNFYITKLFLNDATCEVFELRNYFNYASQDITFEEFLQEIDLEIDYVSKKHKNLKRAVVNAMDYYVFENTEIDAGDGYEVY
jgi:hypothetical protein